jgi:hypothetical protein
MKIVLNKKAGYYDLSPKAIKLLIQIDSPCVEKMHKSKWYDEEYTSEQISENIKEDFKVDLGDGYLAKIDINTVLYNDCIYMAKHQIEYRSHPDLIKVIELLKDEAFGPQADLQIVDIPDDITWDLQEDYGIETIHETHRIW